MSSVSTTPKITLADIEQQVTINLPTLNESGQHTLEQLVGEKFWKAIAKPDRLVLGHEFREKADKGQLPVSKTGKTACNKILYQKF